MDKWNDFEVKIQELPSSRGIGLFIYGLGFVGVSGTLAVSLHTYAVAW
jgi:hypothetical protein